MAFGIVTQPNPQDLTQFQGDSVMLKRRSNRTRDRHRRLRCQLRNRIAQFQRLEDRHLLTVYVSGDVPLVIPDQSTASSILSVPDAITIDDVSIQHY